jgi:hypothetical protein
MPPSNRLRLGGWTLAKVNVEGSSPFARSTEAQEILGFFLF